MSFRHSEFAQTRRKHTPIGLNVINKLKTFKKDSGYADMRGYVYDNHASEGDIRNGISS